MDNPAAPLTVAECYRRAVDYRTRAEGEVDSVMRASLAHLADTFAALARSRERLQPALRGH